MRRTAFVALFLSAWAAPGFAQDHKAAVQQHADQFAHAANKGDVSAVSAFYTEDAYLLPPGAKMMKGRQDIQSFWAEQLKNGSNLKITVVDVSPVADDVLREIGTFTYEDQKQPRSGKYVSVLRKVGENWRLATHTWNLDDDRR